MYAAIIQKWEDENSYRHLVNASDEQFAWEFMRRSPEYQEEYEHAFQEHRLWQQASEQMKVNYMYFFPAREEGETFDGWSMRIASMGIEPKYHKPLNYYALPWHIHQMQDPAIDDTPTFTLAGETPRILRHEEVDAISGTANPDDPACDDPVFDQGLLPIVFDLEKTWHGQQKKAKKIFQEAQERHISGKHKNINSNKEAWIRHLRALDAKANRATHAQLARKLAIGSRGNHPTCDDISNVSHFLRTSENLTTKESIAKILSL